MGERQERNLFLDIPNEIKIDDPNFDLMIKDKYIVIDMGCGHGDFMIEHTQKNPDKFYIGIEISRKRADKAARRLNKRNIVNFCMICDYGETALKSLMPDNSIDEMNINFPDPWLREKQWKNRILKPSFIIEALRVLKPEGALNFVTDVAKYAKYASHLLSRFPMLKNNYDEDVKKDLYASFPTLFYKKMSPLRNINYVSYKKKQYK